MHVRIQETGKQLRRLVVVGANPILPVMALFVHRLLPLVKNAGQSGGAVAKTTSASDDDRREANLPTIPY
jgi:hypothetical protein